MKNNSNGGAEKISNQSSDKLLQILECLARERLPVRLQDLSTKVGMSQSTVLRYLNALQSSDYVYQEESTSRYALTWKICKLSDNLNSNLGLRSITAPYVTELVSQLRRGVCLVVEQNYECIYLDCVDDTPTFEHTFQWIGKRAPMHATGSGKILLSQFSQQQLEDYIKQRGLPRCTEYTITSEEVLKKELEEVRHCKIGRDKEECELGLTCVSVPLYNYSANIIAALSVFGDTANMTEEQIQKNIVPALKSVAETISHHLGYGG